MFFPQSISLSDAEQYTLAIRLSAEHFSFAIRNPLVPNGYVYRETSIEKDIPRLDQIEKTIFDLTFLTQRYAQTWVQVVSPHYTLVPSDFFESKGREAFFPTSPQKTDNQETVTLSDTSSSTRNEVLFQMEQAEYEFLSRHLFSPRFTHHTASLLRLWKGEAPHFEPFARMHLHFVAGQMDIAVFREGRLIAFQPVKQDSVQNLFYFAMNLWSACRLQQLHDRIFVSGDTDAYTPLLPLLGRYVQHVETKGAPCETFLMGQDATQTPYDLFGLLL